MRLFEQPHSKQQQRLIFKVACVLLVLSEVLTDDEVPPPLPERTPESFILAVDPGQSPKKPLIKESSC